LVISLIFSNLEVSNNKYCIMITESKVTEIFCIADDFCKEFEGEMAKNREFDSLVSHLTFNLQLIRLQR